ncbi:MAG TPA: aminodeoxychorismate/anthranilate synthase component I, partial [Pirellulaceae bacterium]|nr:aminodeoxychorismate/anthranilate synthase component I [Pirellulaceae bacterium]
MPGQSSTPSLPLVVPLPPEVDALRAFEKLCRHPHCLFLDSALKDAHLGRYSFVAVDPFDYFTAPADGSDALELVAQRMRDFSSATVLGLPPFQGGAAGLLSYDLGRSLERVPRPCFDEFQSPALAIGLYDTVLAFDHQQAQGWIISHGWPATTSEARRQRAAQRVAEVQSWLRETTQLVPKHSIDALSVSELAPQYPVSELTGL